MNAPLRFGVLMENCGRAGPTTATVAVREARTRLDHEKETNSKRREGRTAQSEQDSDTQTLL